ncbi:MAG TPA: T9SS type A sorting domain-containing protein [Flavobacterium sp.]|jgi:uncharacterized repeat protein (TIGR01451 family)
MKTKLLLLFSLITLSSTSFGQIGFSENIVTGFNYSTKGATLVKAADLDGDGDLDVVGYGMGMNWYENIDGQGNFGPKKTIEAALGGPTGYSLDVVDFNGDGHPDILGSINNKISIYKNSDGNGNFTLMQTYTLGASYVSLSAVATDMNGDGHMDILCYFNNGGGFFQGWIAWYENNGTGTFGPQQVITDSSTDLIYGSRIFADDLDNDGDNDIVMAYKDGSRLSWFENTGNATFAGAVTISQTAGGISSVMTADVDGDGDKDIISTQQTDNQVAWYKNLDGQANFSDEIIVTSSATATMAALAYDIDNNGSTDIVYTGTNEIGWLGNAGTGSSFTNPEVITNKAFGVRGVIMADLDGDGKDDMVSASYADDKIAWYKNLDNGNFDRQVVIARRIKNPNNVYPADFDGDGDIDILANSQHDAKLTWFENVNGIGFYGKEHIVTEDTGTGNTTPIAYPLDADGDGDIDIVSNEDSHLFWYENDGDGNFETQHIMNNTSAATMIRGGDLDGDGDLDVLCGVYNSDKLSWYENLGAGNFGSEQVIYDTNDDNGSLTSLAIEDMDGDGDLDFIVSSYSSYVNYYENTDGEGTFVDQNVLVFDWLMAVYPADMDGDGDKDVVGVDDLGGNGFEAVVWYENAGSGNFTEEHDVSTLPIHGQNIWAADIDNDGDIDVLTAAGHEDTSGQLAWYPNNGDGTFLARQMIHEQFNATVCEAVTVADIDNDNDVDVLTVFNLWQSDTLGKVSVFENLGELGNTITGTVTVDTDSNGCGTTDPKGSNMMVISTGGGYSFATFTDENGSFEIPTIDGNFTTAITSQLPAYFISNPASYSFNFSGLNDSGTANFCVAPSGTVNDLVISAYPLTEVRPGFPVRYRIVYRNNGTTALGGMVNFNFDNGKLNFVSASQAPVVSGNMLAFSFEGLDLFEIRTIDLEFQAFTPPVTNIGDQLTTTVNIQTTDADQTPDDNIFVVAQTVIGSYDPNDIRCLEGEQVLIQDADEYLHYIIRFQNTGTASAINVRVENPLDTRLDWTSMQLESMSHNGRVELINENNLRFIFDNINLAASSANEPASHGFIAYKIKPAEVVTGDVVESTADIYFDFNPAIATNTAYTEFVGQLSIPEVASAGFRLYPNPTTGVLHLVSAQPIDEVQLVDLNGRVLQQLDFKSPSTAAQVDLSAVAKGVYLIKVNDEWRKVVKE